MKRFFHTELEKFRSNIVLMGEKSADNLRLAIKALTSGDTDVAQEVLDADDEIDRLEVVLDAEAIRYITLRQPVATELRLLAVGMKAGHDLERVGDEASSIAKRARKLADAYPKPPLRNIPTMADLAAVMLKDTLTSLINEDEELAISVCERDKTVDDLNRENFRLYSADIVEDTSRSAVALELMFVSKSLERAADHATNIAEEVIYLLRGEDVRHTPEFKNPVASSPRSAE